MILTLLLMGLLLLVSAFFSGSETAFFSLSDARVHRLSQGSSRVDRAIACLLADPGTLLFTILTGNLTVNVLYFSLAAALMGRFESRLMLVLFTLGTLSLIVVYGEIMPKALALARSLTFARLTVVPLSFCQLLFRPVRLVLGGLTRNLLRRMSSTADSGRRLQAGELADFLRTRPEWFGFAPRTSRLLQAVMELDQVKVKEVMLPRVDVPSFDLDLGIRRLRAELVGSQLPWVLLYKGEPEQVLGLGRARDILLPQGDRPLIDRVVTLPVIPEAAPLALALTTFVHRRADFGLVVDEYGGMAGLLSTKQLSQAVVGEFSEEFETRDRDLVALNPGRWHLAGSLSLRRWREEFPLAQEVRVPAEVETLGGLVVSLLGRLPREGDRVDLGPCRFRVLRVRRKRVLQVEMTGWEGEGP